MECLKDVKQDKKFYYDTELDRAVFMRIVIILFFILLNEVLNNESAKEHVHFKIHVPEIIKHQIHTKTVFIHIHKPDLSAPKKKPKKKEKPPKKVHHKETHHEDWSSWNSYGYHSDHNDKSNDESFKSQKDHKDDYGYKEADHKKNTPFAQYHRDSYMPMLQQKNKPDYLKGQHGDVMGYSYPPQYAVKEDVKENDDINDIEPYVHTYEEGYGKGGESASGHIYTDDVTKFYADKHEEGEHSAEEFQNDSRERTHAGRYFVDDSEYQQNNKAVKRVSPKMSGTVVKRIERRM
ncbi:hypothetical protein P5V15_000476 [Pogonomyrmex californicus]